LLAYYTAVVNKTSNHTYDMCNECITLVVVAKVSANILIAKNTVLADNYNIEHDSSQ